MDKHINKQDFKFSKDHVWIKKEGKTALLGLTGYAQELIGRIQNIEFVKDVKTVTRDQPVATVEGQKSIFDILSPVSGTLVETNGALASDPEPVNSDPFGTGWFIRITLTDDNELKGLFTEDAYLSYTEQR